MVLRRRFCFPYLPCSPKIFKNKVPKITPNFRSSKITPNSSPTSLAPPKFAKIKFQKITPKFPPEIQPPKLLRFFSRYNFAKKINIAKMRERERGDTESKVIGLTDVHME
jgi:hypothetical protein